MIENAKSSCELEDHEGRTLILISGLEDSLENMKAVLA